MKGLLKSWIGVEMDSFVDGLRKNKNSLDDLFIFCSSKILFHMNVSVVRKKVCLLYYLCLF